MTDYKTATLKELGLDNIEFPEGFTPRWYAGDSLCDTLGNAIKGELYYYVYDNEPPYSTQFDMWAIYTLITVDEYEVGLRKTNLSAKDSLIKIVSEEEKRLILALDYFESGCRCILDGTMPTTEAIGWDKVKHYEDNCKCGRRCK